MADNKEKDQSVDIKFLLDTICGDTGVPSSPSKCVSYIYNSIIYDDGEKMLQDADTPKPVITIRREDDFIFVCMDFRASVDKDFNDVYNVLKKYGELMASTDPLEGTPVNALLMVPKAFPNLNITCINPVMWILQPGAINGPVTQLHILYRTSTVYFNTNSIDADEIEADELDALDRKIKNERAQVTKLEKEFELLQERERILKATQSDEESSIDMSGINSNQDGFQ